MEKLQGIILGLLLSLFIYIVLKIMTHVKKSHEKNKYETFQELFDRTVAKDPNFVKAKNEIEKNIKITARDFRPDIMTPNELIQKGWLTECKIPHSIGFEIVDRALYKDVKFIDFNKQATNQEIQDRNFAEIVYLLEEYITLLNKYPDQIHSVAEVQRKAVFEKFIILKVE